MKFLIFIAIVLAVVAVWRLRVPIMAKVLGQEPSRVQRQLDRKRRS